MGGEIDDDVAGKAAMGIVTMTTLPFLFRRR
jgi:hypothetical protein